MGKRDDYAVAELTSQLEPGEKLDAVGLIFTGPLWRASLLLGAVGQAIFLDYYYAGLTNRRVILIRTGQGWTGFKLVNRGVESLPFANLTKVESGGFMAQRWLRLTWGDGTSRMIRFNSWASPLQRHKELVAELELRLRNVVAAGAPAPEASPPPPPVPSGAAVPPPPPLTQSIHVAAAQPATPHPAPPAGPAGPPPPPPAQRTAAPAAPPAPADPSAAVWFHMECGKKVGPASAVEIRALRDAGKISPATPVWRQGLVGWVALSRSELA